MSQLDTTHPLAAYLAERVWPSDEDGEQRRGLWRELSPEDQAAINALDEAAESREHGCVEWIE